MTHSEKFDIPGCAPPDPYLKKPVFTPPAGSCDCHAHISGPESQFPYTSNGSYTPADGSLASYKNMLGTLGLDRAIVVQSSVYGADNRATLDGVKKGGENFRGVMVVDEHVSVQTLSQVYEIGIIGVRLNLLFKGGISIQSVKKIADRIQPFGWHLAASSNMPFLLITREHSMVFTDPSKLKERNATPKRE